MSHRHAVNSREEPGAELKERNSSGCPLYFGSIPTSPGLSGASHSLTAAGMHRVDRFDLVATSFWTATMSHYTTAPSLLLFCGQPSHLHREHCGLLSIPTARQAPKLQCTQPRALRVKPAGLADNRNSAQLRSLTMNVVAGEATLQSFLKHE